LLVKDVVLQSRIGGGVFRDCPVSKGCTSPFAPIWIDCFVSRQKS